MKAGLVSRSLGVRMAALFSILLLANGVFMMAFFPGRMAAQARVQSEQRAAAIAQVMATALGPAVEFDDADNAADILAWLATTRDARFGVVDHEDGRRLATWRGDAAPAGHPWSDRPHLERHGELLVVTVAIVGLGGGRGTLHAGFSLRALSEQRASARLTVAEASGVVVVLGVLATLMLAAVLVRPIRRLTVTAGQIARGEVAPALPRPRGRDEVAQMTDSLSTMLERLNEVNRQLQTASRHAGMAEVATGVLHNVGNVLNSVNVAVELLHDRTRAQPLDRLRRLETLLAQAGTGAAIDRDRLAAAGRYVAVVADTLERGRAESLQALDGLRGHLDHVKSVVAMQNAYARPGGVVDTVEVAGLVDEALELAGLRTGPGVTLAIEVGPATVAIDRHRVLQIVVNLLNNARDAVKVGPGPGHIVVRAAVADGQLAIAVADDGVGIAADAIARIFAAGYTTKPRGHGYGLHSSALSARQLGGALTVTSDGAGRGATFTLRVPVAPA